nr:hypothetical protein [uncultured Cohaesibacter sp.]
MLRFKVEYKNSKTKRKNRRTFMALDLDSLKQRFMQSGDEIISIEEIVFPASEKQKNEMKKLGLPYSDGLAFNDANDLINNAIDKRPPAHQRDREHARFFGVYAGRFANKKRIYDDIYIKLADRTDLSEFAQWYVYRVYRSLADRSAPGVLDDPSHEQFKAIALRLLADADLARSLRRNRFVGPKVSLRWFGNYTTPEGDVLEGASTKTSTYSFVTAALIDAGLLTSPKPDSAAPISLNKKQWMEVKKLKDGAATGCFGMVCLCVVLSVAIGVLA